MHMFRTGSHKKSGFALAVALLGTLTVLAAVGDVDLRAQAKNGAMELQCQWRSTAATGRTQKQLQLNNHGLDAGTGVTFCINDIAIANGASTGPRDSIRVSLDSQKGTDPTVTGCGDSLTVVLGTVTPGASCVAGEPPPTPLPITAFFTGPSCN